MNKSEAIQVLNKYRDRTALLKSSFHFGDNSVDRFDIQVTDDLDEAIRIAIASLEEDCKARREVKRYKRKYHAVLGAVKQVYSEVMNMTEETHPEMDLVTLKSFLREHFLEYVIRKQDNQ